MLRRRGGGQVTGRGDTLYPPGQRLPCARLLLVGLGARRSLRRDGGAHRRARALARADKLAPRPDARAVTPPERRRWPWCRRGARRGALGAARARARAHRARRARERERDVRVVILESAAGQKEAAELVARARASRARPRPRLISRPHIEVIRSDEARPRLRSRSLRSSDRVNVGRAEALAQARQDRSWRGARTGDRAVLRSPGCRIRGRSWWWMTRPPCAGS